jgi:cysteine desulfurase family protein (TIGR01976 family)
MTQQRVYGPAMDQLRPRFPGLADGWARFDGPAGTQVVDTAIEATAAWQRSGDNANSHGAFAASAACDELIDGARSVMGRLLGADPAGMVFGPSTTSNVMGLTRAIARELGPGDEIVCTQLDHDSNVSPWLLAAADTGATVRMAPIDVATGRLSTEAVTDLLTDRTRWVAVTGASNAIGTIPDVPAIVDSAHEAGAKVVVDGVHLTPHRPVDVSHLGCDVYSTSSYKWYGPHLGVTWVEPELLESLVAYKVRPAADTGPGKFELGTPQYESLAGLIAAAEFLLAESPAALAERETQVFSRLLDGLLAIDRVRVLGPDDLTDRAPTLAFVVEDHTPDAVARALAEERIAVWDGHYYAVELMEALGLGEKGAVRAGVVAYIDHDDVERLVEAVARIAGG